MSDITKNILKIGFVVILFIAFLFIFRIWQTSYDIAKDVIINENSQMQNSVPLLAIDTNTGLKGKKIIEGFGYEPGFHYDLSIEGDRIGLDLLAQNGEVRFLGLLDITKNDKDEKDLAGYVIDSNKNKLNIDIKIVDKKCMTASGDEVTYTTQISIGKDLLKGCAKDSK